jgi:hypothetical protein
VRYAGAVVATGRKRGIFRAALFTALLSVAPPLAAQDAEALAQARANFNEAIALQTAGDCAGALEKFHAVARIKLTPQVQFNIALCEERLGRLVAALGHYRLALVDAEAQSIDDVGEPARTAIESLESRIPRLRIVRGQGAAGASIALDSTELGDANIGSELRRDPGPHRVVAHVNGRQVFESSFRLAEGEKRDLVVIVAEPRQSSASTPPPPAPSPAAPPPPAPSDSPEDRGGSRRTLGFVAGGIGAAGLVSAAVFLVLRQNAINELEDSCEGLRCPESAESTIDRGKLYTGLAEGSAVLGVAGLTFGAVLLFGAAPRKAARPSNFALLPDGRGGLGARLTTRF